MAFESETPVRELALRCAGAIPVLEHEGIDYYCEGNRSLCEACSIAHADLAAVSAKLAAAADSPGASVETDWRTGSLVAFLAHLEERFHRSHAGSLAKLIARYEAVHVDDDPFRSLGPILRALRDVSDAHHETATTVFAAAMTLESGATLDSMPLPPLVRVVHNLACEHVRLRSLLRAARSLTAGYAAPASAPTELREFYSQLVAWEREAHGHAHLENNVLVPWAATLDPVANRNFATSRAATEAPIVVTL
jgi:iron-sulfur cluster repair protein YtfE (RIC family)